LTQVAGNHALPGTAARGTVDGKHPGPTWSPYTLEHAQRIARERSGSPAIRAALKSGSSRDIPAGRLTLDLCRHQADLPSPSCFLLDATGKVVVNCESRRVNPPFCARPAPLRQEVLSGTFGAYYASKTRHGMELPSLCPDLG